MDRQDILFSSLLGGSKNAKMIQRFNAVQNELIKHVLPPIPFLPPKEDLWKADKPTQNQFFPLSISDKENGVYYLLPYEPMITISGSNKIIKRSVAKQNNLIGSIKERWTQEDYQIIISGALVGSLLTGDLSQCFPISDFERLRDFVTASQALFVRCEPLQLLGINRIVVENFSYPFTKGESVQAYEIKAVSDFSYNLLIEMNYV